MCGIRDNPKSSDSIPAANVPHSKMPRFIQSKPCGIDRFEGQSQARLTNAMAKHIIEVDERAGANENTLPRIIGLEGGWGVGKSNVIRQLEKKLKENGYYLFEYDAWGHQEDLQRRSFLETMTRCLIKDKIVDSSWQKKLNELLAHKITRINKTLPKFSAGAFWVILCLASTTVTTFIAERLADAVELTNKGRLDYILALTLFAFFPILLGLLAWFIGMICCKEMRSLGWLLQISKNENIETTNTETINEEQPNVIKFKNWMQSVSDHIGKKNKKIIIVYDNMDRLPAEKVKELWSSIHTFFSEDGFENVWAIIPFDEKHLACAFGEDEDDKKQQLTKHFIRKTFPITYRVTPPVITDYKKLFSELFVEAFDNKEINQEEQDRINRIFRLENPNATVREIINFINQVVTLRNIWHNDINLLYLAIFILKKDKLLDGNIANHILSGDYLLISRWYRLHSWP